MSALQSDGRLIDALSHHSREVIHAFARREEIDLEDRRRDQLRRIRAALDSGSLPGDHLERFLDHQLAELVAGLPEDAARRLFGRVGIEPPASRRARTERLERALLEGRIGLERFEELLRDELVAALGEAPDAAIRGFCRRHGLPVDGDLPGPVALRPIGDRGAQLDSIQGALAAGEVGLEDLAAYLEEIPRVSAAVERLARRRPLVCRGFVLRQQLDIPEDPETQLARLVAALFDGAASAADLESYLSEISPIDEAVGWLKKFRRKEPPTDGYLALLELPRVGTLAEKWAAIRLALYSGQASLASLVDYLDGLAETGRHHLFFYRIDRKRHADYLAQLADPEHHRGRLEDAGLEDCVGSPRFVWKPERPELAAIEIRGDHTLLMKWVATRHWKERRDRVVCFFRVGLKTGEAEIRIQKIERDFRNVLRGSLHEMQRLVRQTIDFDLFSPVLLESAMRQLLRAEKFRVVRFRLELPHGGAISGQGGGGSLLNTLKLAFRKFFAVELKGDWVAGGRKHRLRINGRTDELCLEWEWERRDHTPFLRWIQSGGTSRVSGPERPSPETELVLEKGLRSIREIGRRTVDLDDLKKDVPQSLYSFRELLAAFEKGAPGYRELLGIYYTVRCPDTGGPVRGPRGIRKFKRHADVPDRIACASVKKKPARHKTAGALRVTFPNLKLPINPRIFIPYLVLTGALILTSLAHGYLFSQVESAPLRWVCGASLAFSLLILLALKKQVIGQGDFDEAKEELLKLIAFVKGALSPGEDWGLERVKRLFGKLSRRRRDKK